MEVTIKVEFSEGVDLLDSADPKSRLESVFPSARYSPDATKGPQWIASDVPYT